MSMLDVLLRGIRSISYLGSLLPSQPTVAFTGAGVSVANNDSLGQIVVTIPGVNPVTPVAPTEWVFGQGSVYSFPEGVNQRTLFDTTAGAITGVLDASPVNGEVQGFKDDGLALGTHALTISSGGANIEFPAGTIGTAPLVFGGGFLGVGMSWQWVTSKETWSLCG